VPSHIVSYSRICLLTQQLRSLRKRKVAVCEDLRRALNFGQDRIILVESEALVRAFSPDSILEPGLKTFRRLGPK
jgi:hypothetical protein